MRTFDVKENPTLAAMCDAAEISNNGTLWVDLDGKIWSANQSLIEQLGYTADNFAINTIFEINPTMSIRSWRKLWKRLQEESQVAFSSEQITTDSTIYPVELRGKLVDLGKQKLVVFIIESMMETNRYKDLLELTSRIANIGSWEWDLVNDEFIFNKEIHLLLELPKSTKLSNNVFDSVIKKGLSKKDLKVYTSKMKGAKEEGRSFEFEFSLEVGEAFHNFNMHVQPVKFEDEVIKLYGTLQNVDKLTKRTDDMYFTKYSMDYARDMIYWLNSEGIITYANQTACEKVGYDQDELINKPLSFIDYHYKEDYGLFWEKLKAAKTLELESIHTTKDGKEIPVSIETNYINFKGKEFNCVFLRDLTAKIRKNRTLKIAKHTLDHSLDMIYWLNEDGSFKYCNESFIEMTGYADTEVYEMKVIDFLADKDIEYFKSAWEQVQTGKKIIGIEQELRTKSGALIPCEMNMSMVQFDEDNFTVTVLRDATQHKEKEKKILQQMEEIASLQEATHQENVELKNEIDLEFNFSNIISRDPNYKRVLRQVEQVADTNATVLVTGETGTGKELLARAIHQLSEREEKPMVKVNCGAIPENLIESELFGHEKGAFTGAYQRKIGKFERAHKGTIFLDEIGELPINLQPKLLRVLQEGEFERVGGTEMINVDVRVVTATNRNLEEEVLKGNFRKDLWYRLNVFPIHNIPLRERKEDIPLLVKYFAEKYSKNMNKEILEISAKKMNKLIGYSFLGNVRELENLVERAVILSKNGILQIDLPVETILQDPSTDSFLPMEDMQRKHIIDALEITNGKIAGENGAATLLGMHDKTLTSRMRKMNIGKHDYLKREEQKV